LKIPPRSHRHQHASLEFRLPEEWAAHKGYEGRPELIRNASTFAALSVLLPNMFDQVAVALLLLAGTTLEYVIGIRQSDRHDQADKKGWRDGRR
jgi:hypothetical protein